MEAIIDYYSFKDIVKALKEIADSKEEYDIITLTELIRKYKCENEFVTKHNDSIESICNSNKTTIYILTSVVAILWFFTGYIIAISSYSYYFIFPTAILLFVVSIGVNRSKFGVVMSIVVLTVVIISSFYYFSVVGMLFTLLLSLLAQIFLVKLILFILKIDINSLVKNISR